MKTALAVAQVVIGVLAVLGILLQTPKSTGLGGTIGGGGTRAAGTGAGGAWRPACCGSRQR